MNTYKTIELADGSEWACNRLGMGLFRRDRDGTWRQYTGTGQTPIFRSAAHFSRWLHAHYRSPDHESLPRMVASYGWR